MKTEQSNYSIKQASELNRLLGYRGLVSFAKLYPNGGSINAFGWPDSSMHTIKHEFQSFFDGEYKPDSGLIRFVDTHTTYFKVMPNTSKLNKWLDANGSKTVAECIDYLKTKIVK